MTQTVAGEWVPVQLPDGSWRHDWQPAEQAPSPDGSLGVWRLVPSDVSGYGNWMWFRTALLPAPRVAATEPRMTPHADPWGSLRSRRTQVVIGVLAVLALVLVLTRGGGDAEEPIGVSTLPGSQKETLLLAAASAYTTALVAGKGAEAAAFLDPKVCGANDRKDVTDLAAFLVKAAPGGTVKVTTVQVRGDNGNVTGYEYSADVPAEVRAIMDQGYTSGGEYSWHLRGEKWYFDAECRRAAR